MNLAKQRIKNAEYRRRAAMHAGIYVLRGVGLVALIVLASTEPSDATPMTVLLPYYGVLIGLVVAAAITFVEVRR